MAASKSMTFGDGPGVSGRVGKTKCVGSDSFVALTEADVPVVGKRPHGAGASLKTLGAGLDANGLFKPLYFGPLNWWGPLTTSE